MAAEETGAFRQIFKATSIFGGVQIFNILLGLIRGKVTAVLLGEAGFGLFNLLGAPLTMIGSVTGLGINYSAVRDMSEAHASGDEERFARTVKTFRRWVWFTGSLGMLVTVIGAYWLSYSSFGHADYTWAFTALSVTLLLSAISAGQSSVMQATRRLSHMAISGILCATASFLISIPLYYCWGINGIIPLLVLSGIVGLGISWYYARQVPVQEVSMTWKESYRMGIGFAKVGFMITLSNLLQQAIGYGFTAFLSHSGGLALAGLYAAGSNLTWRYSGMVFQAMGADYYPRLSAISNDNRQVCTTVNQQAELSILIVGAFAALFIIFLPLIVRILLTEEFLVVVPFCMWIMLSILVKAFSWSIGFISLAKSWSKVYFNVELVASVLNALFLMEGYRLGDLEGLGVGCFVSSLTYLAGISIYYYTKIRYKPSSNVLITFSVLMLLNITLLVLLRSLDDIWAYICGAGMVLVILTYVLSELNKRLDLADCYTKIKTKLKRI